MVSFAYHIGAHQSELPAESSDAFAGNSCDIPFIATNVAESISVSTCFIARMVFVGVPRKCALDVDIVDASPSFSDRWSPARPRPQTQWGHHERNR